MLLRLAGISIVSGITTPNWRSINRMISITEYESTPVWDKLLLLSNATPCASMLVRTKFTRVSVYVFFGCHIYFQRKVRKVFRKERKEYTTLNTLCVLCVFISLRTFLKHDNFTDCESKLNLSFFKMINIPCANNKYSKS
jgi:hypothetical protein